MKLFEVVGYGVYDATNTIYTRHTRSGLVVDKVGSTMFRPVGDNVPPRTFTIDGPTDCKVDSGGPAFSENGALIGVFSQFVGDCASRTAVNYFTDVAPFRDDLILRAFQDAGYQPWLEGNSEPGLYGTGGASSLGGSSSTGGASSAGGASSSGGGSSTSGGASLGGATSSSVGGTLAVTTAGAGTSMGATSSNGGTTSAPLGGAPPATSTSTDAAVIYDKGGSQGGSCACRFAGNRRGSFGLVLLTAAALGARRRRQRLRIATRVRAPQRHKKAANARHSPHPAGPRHLLATLRLRLVSLESPFQVAAVGVGSPTARGAIKPPRI